MNTLAQNQTFEQTTLITVPFYGNELFVVAHNNEPFVPMKSIVENMGLDWAGQYTKLKSNAKRWGIEIISIPNVSNLQQAVCLPLRKLFGWLGSISPNKVKPEIRDTVIKYQEECDDVLYNYWTKGVAVQRPYQMPLPTMSDKRTRVPLKDAVTLLVAKSRNMNYSEAYGLIHQRFDVDSVEDLTNEQIPLAVEYIHRVVGEFIGKEALPAPKPVLVADLPKVSVFEHKRQHQRYFLSLDVLYDGYGLQGNPLRRLFALLKQAQNDGATVAVNDIDGAVLVFDTIESLARQYKQSLDQLSRHAANASGHGCFLPIKGC